MKTILAIFAFLLTSLTIKAQDIITLKNGTEIKGVITEITPEQVKFKKTADGPIFTLAKADVFMIVYENGRKEVFTAETTPAPTNENGKPADKKNGTYKEPGEETFVPKKHYGGPRVGFTALGDGLVSEQIHSNIISQFGWQFETRFFTLENGGSGLVEFVPLIGGLESGKFIPSVSGLVGYRAANGFEFGCGPNLSLSGFGIVFAAGASYKVGNVCFPINIAFQPSIEQNRYEQTGVDANGYVVYGNVKRSTGFRVSLLIGFNARNN
jgi:hypothetical protein